MVSTWMDDHIYEHPTYVLENLKYSYFWWRPQGNKAEGLSFQQILTRENIINNQH